VFGAEVILLPRAVAEEVILLHQMIVAVAKAILLHQMIVAVAKAILLPQAVAEAEVILLHPVVVVAMAEPRVQTRQQKNSEQTRLHFSEKSRLNRPIQCHHPKIRLSEYSQNQMKGIQLLYLWSLQYI
jgi:hypothetical protein